MTLARMGRVSGRWVRSLVGSVGATLFVWLLGLIVAAFGTYAVLSVHTTSRQWESATREWARRLQDVILQSTYHAMLLDRKEDVGQIVRMVARTPGVEGVRIYDHRGLVALSSDARPAAGEVL